MPIGYHLYFRLRFRFVYSKILHGKDLIDTLCELVYPLAVECLKLTVIECLSDFFHKLVIEIEVVQNTKAHTEQLTCLKQMTDI